MTASQFLYLMLDPLSRTKIGVSKDPLTRKKQIETDLKTSVQIITVYDCADLAFKVEAYLHKHFKDKGKHITGEWFSLKEEDRQNVKPLIQGYLQGVKDSEEALQNMTKTVQYARAESVAVLDFEPTYSTDLRKDLLVKTLLEAKKIGVKVKRKQLASTLGITKRTLTNWMNELSMHIG